MKIIKLLFFMLTLSFLVVGCSENKKLNELTADKKGHYALYVVGDELDGSELDEEGIIGISLIMNASSLETAQEEYPFLKIKKSPEYLVFDDKELIHRTTEYSDLVKFLKNK